MSANYNDAAISAVLEKLVAYNLASARVDQVNTHEPKNAPGNQITCAIWVQSVKPIRASGLAATSGVVLYDARFYQNFKSQPFDMIDPNLQAAATDFMGSMTGDFNLGGTGDTRHIDLLGAYGATLSMQAGYVEIDRGIFRIMTVAVPIVINDMFTQKAT